MSEVEEKKLTAPEEVIPQEELDKLPKDTVHCFPASKTQILRRRIITLLVMALDGAAVGYLLAGKTDPGPLLWCVFGAILVVAAVVFIHTFVIAKYRVAMDYKNNEVVLRYMFSKITIPFDSFDGREGAADRATQLLQNSALGANMARTDYLILDNVYEEVCYQTSSKDLASKEDFDLLSKEAKLVSSVYKAKEKYDALKTDEEVTPKISDDESVSLVKDAMKEVKEEAEAETAERVREAEEAAKQAEAEIKEEAEKAAEAAEESVEEAVSEEPEKEEE